MANKRLVNRRRRNYHLSMIGSTVSHYRILEKLGHGGMGEVFLAEDLELKRKVAIKFLPPHVAQDEEMLQRFQREARATAALQHPNIVTIHEIGSHEERRFIVMAFIDGDLLSHRISRGDLSVEAIIQITFTLADALSEAHVASIIHRDLKPDNIIIDRRGQPHVLDFGLAVQGGATRLTSAGSTVGTLHYMSPEQASGEEVDERTDIFSLGAILYEMITGRKAFPGDNTAAIINRIVNDDPPPVTRYNPDVTDELDRIVATALAKDRGVRYQTMRALAEALRPLLQWPSGSAVATGTSGTTGRNAVVSKRRRGAWVTAAVASVAIAAIWMGYKALAPTRPSVHPLPEETGAPRVGQIRTLAVLPLRNNAQAAEEAYFADAMTEALIDDLSRVSALTVFPASTIMNFKGSTKSAQEIAVELDADAVITGSVWQDAGRVRINVDLVPAGASERLWGESYESEFDDLLALQSRLAREITGQVKVSLAPLESAWLNEKRSVSPEALKVYLKGLYYRGLMTEDGYEKCGEMFERAIAVDPSFAPAYAALADVRLYDTGWEDALELVNKALVLDPNLVDALALLAHIQIRYMWDWNGARETIEKATSLQPNNPYVHQAQGDLLLAAGRHQEGLREYRTAVALSPLSHPIACSLVSKYNQVHDFDRVIDYGLKVDKSFPDCPFELLNVGEAYMYKGQYNEALEYLENSEAVYALPGTRAMMGCVYALSGQKEKANGILEELAGSKVSAYDMAELQAALGNDDLALDWLEKAYEQRSSALLWINRELIFKNLRDHPRFIQLVAKVNLPTG